MISSYSSQKSKTSKTFKASSWCFRRFGHSCKSSLVSISPQHNELSIFDWSFGGSRGGGDVILTKRKHLCSLQGEEGWGLSHCDPQSISISAATPAETTRRSHANMQSKKASLWMIRLKFKNLLQMFIRTHTKTSTHAFITTIHPHCLCTGSREQQWQTMYVFTPVHWEGLLGVKHTHLHPWLGDSLSSTLELMLLFFVPWKNKLHIDSEVWCQKAEEDTASS